MGLSRRNVLVGLGGLVAGGGALVGTGAFTTVQAERTVNVETAGDANAFLALDEVPNSANSEYIDTSGDTIAIDITSTQQGGQGLNQNAITTIRNIVRVTNNGTQGVTELTLEFTDTPGSVDPDTTFDFLVDEGSNSANLDHSSGGVDILTGNNSISGTLGTGDSIDFGLEIDLINGGNNGDLPQGGSYALTITANTA
jgi:hypothetical protein